MRTKEQIAQYAKQYAKTERGHQVLLDAKRRWYKKNKEKTQAYSKMYRQTERGKILARKDSHNAKLRYPEKEKARTAVGNAIKSGKITKQPCEICGGPGHAHHEDYSRPLDVRWLCRSHHIEVHRRNVL